MAKAPAKGYALDIFRVLDHINARDYSAYTNWTDSEQKAFQPYVAMKWMLGTDNKRTLLRLNARANLYMFCLGQHKQLLHMLLCACTNGKSQRYSWIKTSNKQSSMSTTLEVVQEFYHYSERHAKQVLSMLSKDEVLDMAQWLGRQSDELTKIKNEFKSRDKATT